jgi:hypothetical protein
VVGGSSAIPSPTPQPAAQEDQIDESWWNENIAEEEADASRADDEAVKEGDME